MYLHGKIIHWLFLRCAASHSGAQVYFSVLLVYDKNIDILVANENVLLYWIKWSLYWPWSRNLYLILTINEKRTFLRASRTLYSGVCKPLFTILSLMGHSIKFKEILYVENDIDSLVVFVLIIWPWNYFREAFYLHKYSVSIPCCSQFTLFCICVTITFACSTREL